MMVEKSTRRCQKRNWARISAGSLIVTGIGGSGLNKAVNELPAMAQLRNPAHDGQPEMRRLFTQREIECCPLMFDALGPDFPIVPVDDALHRRQSEANAFEFI